MADEAPNAQPRPEGSLLAPRPEQIAHVPPGPPLLVVLVDAEEEFDWDKPFSNGSVSVSSMRHQHRAQAIFARYGVVPTYVVDYPVASQPDGYRPLRELLADGACQIGAQLHPWVNPPYGEQINVYNSFPGNLPRELELAKLARLTEIIETNFGIRPSVYKAGRYGVGPNTAAALEQNGYRIDTSVVSRRSFALEHGADFEGLGPHPYWFGSRSQLLELPLTCDFTGPLRQAGRRLYPRLSSKLGRRLHFPGVLARTSLLNRVHLTPEGIKLSEAKLLTRTLIAAETRIFILAYHSPSLEPGHTPYVRDQGDLRRFIDWLDGYFEFFLGEVGGRPATPVEVSDLLSAERDRHAVWITPQPRPPIRVTHVSASGSPAFTCAPRVEVAAFDFLSHETMHHPFNEGYLRMLRAAFPGGRIVFHASAGHVERISSRLSPLQNLVLRVCPPFPSNEARHNPLTGRWAARRCLDFMLREAKELKPRLVVVLGADANLLSVVGRRWPKLSTAQLHLILHSHLGEAMLWRSRNPLIRSADFVAQLAKPLPANVSLVALELGIKQAITELWPNVGPSIVTLEHPVLTSEWAPPAPSPGEGRFVVAFLGHARRAKGFEVFADLARTVDRPDMVFDAIGISSTDSDAIDQGGLRMTPSRTGLTRAEYLDALRRVDVVCSPLHSRAYDFTASGTISDAVAALKPVIAFRNRTLEAIEKRYGSIGLLVDSREELFSYFAELDRESAWERCAQWVQNIARMREARRPESLAPGYAELLNN